MKNFHCSEKKRQETDRQKITKYLIDENKFGQWLNLRATVIEMKNLRKTTKRWYQQDIDTEIFLFCFSQRHYIDNVEYQV